MNSSVYVNALCMWDTQQSTLVASHAFLYLCSSGSPMVNWFSVPCPHSAALVFSVSDTCLHDRPTRLLSGAHSLKVPWS